MQFGFLLEQVVNGLVLGGYYLLIALGLSLIFSVGGIVNLAHGAFYALGAYISVEITKYLGFGSAVVLSPIAVALLGILFERFILRRFYDADPILSLLVTFGLAMVTEQAIRIIWGAPPISAAIPQGLRGSVFLGDFLFSRYRLLILAVVAAVLVGVWLLLHKTSFGRVVRAGIQRPDMVAALGIRLQPYMTAIVMLGVGMAALGGAFFAPITIVHPAMGAEIITVAFVVVVIGGLGSFWGVVLAAMLVGVVRGITIHFAPAAGEASIYVLMFLVLLVRPRGLLGRTYREVRMTSTAEKYRPLLLADARRHRAAVRPLSARAVAQYRHHGGGARHCRDGAQPLHRLYGPGLVRPRRVVRHRRLCGRADPAQLVRRRYLPAAAAGGRSSSPSSRPSSASSSCAGAAFISRC